MRIATGKLFARHNDGYVELWVMGGDGVRPARPSDFQPDAETIRDTGDLRFCDAAGEKGEVEAAESTAPIGPLAVADHLWREADRLAADAKSANEARAVVGLMAIGQRRGGLAGIFAGVLAGEN